MFAAGFNIGFSLLSLIASIIFAYICHRIAVGKGRGPILWAILGFFFWLIALIIIAILPRKNAPAY